MSKQLAENHPDSVFSDANKVISKLELKNPFKFSFFLQNWKMFAPNPPPNCGWIAIEEIRQDGFRYDLISGDLIQKDNPQLHFRLSGLENLLFNPLRGYQYRESWKYRMLLKKWIPYKIHQKYPDLHDYTSFAFTEYILFVSKNNANQPPVMEYKSYPISAVMALPVFVQTGKE